MIPPVVFNDQLLIVDCRSTKGADIIDTKVTERVRSLYEALNAAMEKTLTSRKSVERMSDELHAALFTALQKLKFVDIIWFMPDSEGWVLFWDNRIAELGPHGWFEWPKRPTKHKPKPQGNGILKK